jgi:N-glycosylase/DNA lyase
MRVGRIHGMQQALRREFGEPVEFDGGTYRAFPTPAALANASEADLRELNLGYRAPYVKRSAELVASGDADPESARGLPYEDAREYLTQFVGVGDKVADCILLFSLGYLEAVPLDTWIQTTIAEFYPDCDRGNYTDTSRAIRETLGGEYAGYTQTYLFHYLRSGGRDL